MWLELGRGATALAVTLAAAGCAKGTEHPGRTDADNGVADGGGAGGAGGMDGMSGSSAGGGGGLPASCTRAEECLSFTDACNQDACVNGACARLPDPARENGPCEDGLYCTENEACHNGACVGGAEKVCPGVDACNVGACDEATRSCATAPGNGGQPCPSAAICEVDTLCQDGVCGGGQPRDCTIFDDLCSVGVCDPALGCRPEALSDGTPCNAGQEKPCTTSVCLGGTCQPVAKSDGISCNLGIFTECSEGVCQGAVCQPQPAHDGEPCDDGLFNPCTEGTCSAGACHSGPGNEGSSCDDFLFCTINDRCAGGSCTGDPNTCGPANGCFVFQCNEALQTCSSAPGNDGATCDDGDACTAGTTCAGGVCGAGIPANEGGACVASSCTSGDVCAAGVCVAGQGPTIYFQEDFKDNSRGWILGPEWQIGATSLSTAGAYGSDPALDHSPSADNGVAGVVIGGNESPLVHPYYYLESPAFDTSAAPGPVFLGFYRWLNSDYAPYMHNRVEVYDGAQWVVLWQSGQSPAVQDAPPEGNGWTYLSYEVTSYKSAGMKVRFGYDIGQAGVLTIGSWNVDDVLVASASCP
jgi:hypothetical protein